MLNCLIRFGAPKYMNIPLLRQIQEAIKESPSQFNMSNWFSTYAPTNRTPANCGTAACLAGWTLSLAYKKNPKEAQSVTNCYEEQALEYLDLPSWMKWLFYVNKWPSEFNHRIRMAEIKIEDENRVEVLDSLQLEYNQVAIDLLEHLITNPTYNTLCYNSPLPSHVVIPSLS